MGERGKGGIIEIVKRGRNKENDISEKGGKKERKTRMDRVMEAQGQRNGRSEIVKE